MYTSELKARNLPASEQAKSWGKPTNVVRTHPAQPHHLAVNSFYEEWPDEAYGEHPPIQ